MPRSAEGEPVDRPDEQQFRMDVDGEEAFAQYEKADGVMTFTHTFVPESLRGRGIATHLIEAGLADARAKHLQVVPQCPMVAAYMKAHPETHDLLGDAGRAYLD
jgi:predicted GNAT family acetyltransferase